MTEDEFEQTWIDIETYLFSEGFEEEDDLDDEHESHAKFATEHGIGTYGYRGHDLYVFSPLSEIYITGRYTEEIEDELNDLAPWQV